MDIKETKLHAAVVALDYHNWFETAQKTALLINSAHAGKRITYKMFTQVVYRGIFACCVMKASNIWAEVIPLDEDGYPEDKSHSIRIDQIVSFADSNPVPKMPDEQIIVTSTNRGPMPAPVPAAIAAPVVPKITVVSAAPPAQTPGGVVA
jgi:hypothetical protein